MEKNRFCYIHSCDLNIYVQIKISTLEGDLTKNFFKRKFLNKINDSTYVYDEAIAELFVTAQILSKGKSLSTEVSTNFKTFSNRWSWNEILIIPVFYSQLPEDAEIVLNVWDSLKSFEDISIGNAKMRIFDKSNALINQGVFDIELNKDDSNNEKVSQLSEIKKKYRDKDFPRVEWLDRLTFREIEIMNERERKTSDSIYLVIEFPPFTCDGQSINVIYYEKGPDMVYQIQNPKFVVIPDAQIGRENIYELKHHALTRGSNSIASDIDLKPSTVVRDKLLSIIAYPSFTDLSNEEQDLVWRYRYYLKQNDKALSKFLKSVKWENAVEAGQALNLMNEWHPMDVVDALELLTPEFRIKAVRHYAVTRLQQAKDEDLSSYLLQLVQALRYEDYADIKNGYKHFQALNYQKDSAEISPNQSTSPNLINTAIPGSPLNLKTNQIVSKDVTTACQTKAHLQNSLDLATFLIERASRNSVLANYLYWYLHVECEEQTHLFNVLTLSQLPLSGSPSNFATNSGASNKNQKSKNYTKNLTGDFDDSGKSSAKGRPMSEGIPSESGNDIKEPHKANTIQGEDTETLKLNDTLDALDVENLGKKERSIAALIDPNDQKQVAEIYLTVMKRFHQTLVQMGSAEGLIRRSILSRQQYFMDKLVGLVNSVTRENTNRKRKQDRLQSLLSSQHDTTDFTSSTKKMNFNEFEPLPLPLDPEITVTGIIPEDTLIFKSALMPCLFTFRTTESGRYKLLFKHGDDLRQDQLILQIIKLMDKLLRQENLDLKLTAYKVLATSTKHGLVQFVESQSIAEILSIEGTIQNYFRRYSPSDRDAYGIRGSVMETYIKSCAGYCVITYILGIGDRHFDNLLITKTGKLFHIDFGYILGRDPKPMPPPMKFSKEMVEAMGGTSSKHYQNFKKYCYTAFLHLRRHSNLIMNLFSLMLDANIPDISLERDKTVIKVYEKFRLDLNDEEAVAFIQNLIDVSANAVMAVLVEHIHKIAQYWRR